MSHLVSFVGIAKVMVMNEFGPATEHTHTEMAITLAAAMMQHEGSQIVADAYRAVES